MSITLISSLVNGLVNRGQPNSGRDGAGSPSSPRAPSAGSLRSMFAGSSLVLALGACSGSDADAPLSDAPAGEEAPSTPAAPSMSAPDDGAADTQSDIDGDDIDEDNPDVTGLDGSTLPDNQGSSQANEPEADEDAEAADMSMMPVEAAALVPDTELCAAVADWDPAWVQFEEEVLLLVNEFRSQPADCGVEGQFEPAAPLTMNPILRCSARLHSLDMFERDYFDHNTPDGVDPFERMAEAGFVGSGGGENIALGQRSPEEVMAAWMDSDGHCANVMRAAFDTIGVGYHPGAGMRGGSNNYWTQNFGAPAFMRGGTRR